MSTRSKKPGESAERETAAGPAGSEGRTREKGFYELFPYMKGLPLPTPEELADPEKVEHEEMMRLFEERRKRGHQGAVPPEAEEE